ncbi:hypothetical protein HK100_009498, partial [Physocladia obscura]
MFMLREISAPFPTDENVDSLVIKVDRETRLLENDEDDEDDDDEESESEGEYSSDSDDDEDEEDEVESKRMNSEIENEIAMALFNDDACADDDPDDGEFTLETDDAPVACMDTPKNNVPKSEESVEAPSILDEFFESAEKRSTQRKRKSAATRLAPSVSAEKGGDNFWFSVNGRKDHVDEKKETAGLKLRKMSLAVQAANTTIGRGRGAVRGKKKTAILVPTVPSSSLSPTKKYHNLDSPTKHSRSNGPSSNHSQKSDNFSSRKLAANVNQMQKNHTARDSESDFGFDQEESSLFSVNPFLRDGASNANNSQDQNAPSGILFSHVGTADDELGFLLSDDADHIYSPGSPTSNSLVSFRFSRKDSTPTLRHSYNPPSTPIMHSRTTENQSFSASQPLTLTAFRNNAGVNVGFHAGPSKLKEEFTLQSRPLNLMHNVTDENCTTMAATEK